jgi:CubicO group peptidase (beta-lactamase class C family)
VAELEEVANFSPPEGSLAYRASPPAVALVPNVFNRSDVQAACIPAVGGIANARSVARLFSLYANLGMIGGKRLLSKERIMAMLEPRPDFAQSDETFRKQLPVGMGGLWVVAPNVSLSGPLTDHILAHIGAGGSVGWADLKSGLSVAVCHNRMFMTSAEPPFGALGDAVQRVAERRAMDHPMR